MEKFELNGKKRVELPERRVPSQPLFINVACHPWYGIFLLASLGWLPGYAPSQLLHTSSRAECGKLKKVLDFLANPKNMSVLSTFFFY